MPVNSGRKMAWCSHCGKNCNTSYDYPTNNTSCVDCGKILYEGTCTEPGGSHVRSKFVRIEGSCFKSHRRTSCEEGNISNNELIYTNQISHATRHYKEREMIWCPHCVRKSGTTHDHTTGSVNCVDCGKVLCEDINTKKTTSFRNVAGGKNKRKLAFGAKNLNPAQTDALNTFFGDEQIPVHETEYLVEEHYVKTDGEEWKSYDNEQESCSYDYDYDYDGGDENDGY